MGLDLKFDPATYCEGIEDTDVNKQPVRVLSCFVVEVLELVTPLVKVAKLNVEIFKEVVLSNKMLIETSILAIPVIPLVYLVSYFGDTL